MAQAERDQPPRSYLILHGIGNERPPTTGNSNWPRNWPVGDMTSATPGYQIPAFLHWTAG